MSNSKAGCQTIGCEVLSCAYNHEGKNCELDSIMVQPAAGCRSGSPAEESLCGSYRSRV